MTHPAAPGLWVRSGYGQSLAEGQRREVALARLFRQGGGSIECREFYRFIGSWTSLPKDDTALPLIGRSNWVLDGRTQHERKRRREAVDRLGLASYPEFIALVRSWKL